MAWSHDQRYPPLMVQIRWFSVLLLLSLCSGCAQNSEPWAALEVQRCLQEALAVSFNPTERDRSKALAVQAVSMAGDNPRLLAAAHVGAAWAEVMRGERRLGSSFLRKALEGLEPTNTTNQLLIWLVRGHLRDAKTGEALKSLDWWLERLDKEVHAHLVRPLTALRTEVEAARAPTPSEPPVLNLEDLMKR